MKLNAAALLLCLAVFSTMPAIGGHHGHDTQATAQSGSESGQQIGTAWVDGTVKKVSPDTGKVTISHGPLPNLDMPPMTMVFRVKDSAWLNQMKPGDRILFQVERQNGALTVTEFRASQ
jgi:Cu/Ag efflux protein CusF